MKKEFYLYVNGQKVKVSEEIYKVYWREREHEKYLEQVDRKNHLLFFSSLDHDGHFIDNIVDENVDVEKIVETQMMIEAVRSAITREYIQAMIDSGNEDITPEWIEWALKKADWYDPSIATEDEYLGKRQHEKSAEEKEKSLQDSIRKSWYW